MAKTATQRLDELADTLGLTDRQRRLGIIRVTEPGKPKYTAAAEAGYSVKAAGPGATEALRIPKVKAFISAARTELARSQRGSIADTAEILRFHTRAMRGSLDDYLTLDDKTGKTRVDPAKVAARRKSRLIKEIVIDRDGEIKQLKLLDPQLSADRLAKYYGLYADDDSSRQLQTALTLGALVGTLPDEERSLLARRLMGPLDGTAVRTLDIAATPLDDPKGKGG